MPRTLVIGNGTVLATFDARLQMRDLYFPYVGMEDHTAYGGVHRLGVFVEGKGCAWASDGEWVITPGYRRNTMVTQSTMTHARLGLTIRVSDAVHPIHNALLRHFAISSTTPAAQAVRLFFHHDLRIYGDNQKDTAFYEPRTNAVIHFRQSRYFLIGGTVDKPTECSRGSTGSASTSVLHDMQAVRGCGMSSFSIGKAHFKGMEGTWKDAEDGVLSQNPIEQGSVDSTIGIHALVEPIEETNIHMWVCLGRSLTDVVKLQQHILEDTPERLIDHTAHYWKNWVYRTEDVEAITSKKIADLLKRSLQIVRVHCDNHGGILAAADSDIMAFNRDTYTYVWPRDGAYVAMAMTKAGCPEIARRFFEFCQKAQAPDGYLLQKYNPDGSVGSSWHPWYKNHESQLPIQEDETALVLVALHAYVTETKDIELIQSLYQSFIKKAAQFLCDFRDATTGLPLPSYDLWEEQRGIFTYTTATVIAGLEAASHLAQMLGHHGHSERYHCIADEMKQALLFHLYDESRGCFWKQIRSLADGTMEKDSTIDASTAMVWKLGILPASDPRIIATMTKLQETLAVRTSVGGWARYEGDRYHAAVGAHADVQGNPWIITTLWHAQWLIARAASREELSEALAIIEWAATQASSTGMLPEQLHPHSGAPLSVSPLTWSHAVFIETVLLYKEKSTVLSDNLLDTRS